MTFSASECPDDQVLGLHVDRALGAGEAESVRSHLDSCDSCRAVVAVMARARIAEGTPTSAGTPAARGASGMPRRIDRYRIERLVGAGGMGQVFAAHDTELDRPVALKVIRPELAAVSPAFAERMRRESRLMAKVSHPGVIAVYDVGTDDGQPWIAMELVAGATLGAHLRARPRGWRDVVEWFRRAGAGLAAAHAAGLVHRDFKPDNVLCAIEGEDVVRVLVTDFGVATAAAVGPFALNEPPSDASQGAVAAAVLDLTATGVAIGTPAYMAPEQLEGRDVDARADVFAFAVAMWEALYGARPFRGASVDEIKRAQAKGTLPPARRDDEAGGHVPDEVPGWVANALAPALALDPARRPKLDALLRALDPTRRRKRVRVVAIAAGAAVVAAGGVALAATVLGSMSANAPAVADACGAGEKAMKAIWDGKTQRATRRALATGGLAPTEIERIAALMDERVVQWRTTYETACRAPDPSPSRPLQLACLDARRVEMAGWVEGVLAGGARHAGLLVGALSIPAGCLAPSPASVYAQLPADDAQRARVIELRARLFDAEQERMRGDFAGALASVAQLRPAVDATGFLPLAAELEYLAGTAQSIGGDSQASADILRRAVSLAERGHHDHITAVARLALAQDAALNARDLDLADQHVEFAQAAIDRLGGDAALQIQLDSTRVIILELRGRYAEAESIITALLAAPALPPDTEVQLRQQLGDLYLEETKINAAIEQHRAVIAKLEAMGPAGEANLAILEARLADDLVARGDAAGAVAAAERARALSQKVVAPTHVDHWSSLQNLASAYHLAGRPEDALAAARRFHTELVKLTGEGSVYDGEGLRDEGRYLASAGQRDAGVALIERACSLLELTDALDEGALARCDFDVAEALLQNGRAADALPTLEEVALTLTDLHGDSHPDVAIVHISLGEALIATGNSARARRLLQRSLEVLAASELDPGLAADAGVALARALPASQAARARTLLDDAIARYTGAAPLYREHLAKARSLRAELR